ncbi:hypothetical protein BGZ65_001125 [Modicella reniformis]|uniref:Uncharacterized protein n=1 Tax=Modicella reniformis TaxID=1440133 RepID=A0A9P6IQG9_9FUNG|nr:hypothetical protein BGZ65_001125 [Modicella reniformis]
MQQPQHQQQQQQFAQHRQVVQQQEEQQEEQQRQLPVVNPPAQSTLDMKLALHTLEEQLAYPKISPRSNQYRAGTTIAKLHSFKKKIVESVLRAMLEVQVSTLMGCESLMLQQIQQMIFQAGSLSQYHDSLPKDPPRRSRKTDGLEGFLD